MIAILLFSDALLYFTVRDQENKKRRSVPEVISQTFSRQEPPGPAPYCSHAYLHLITDNPTPLVKPRPLPAADLRLTPSAPPLWAPPPPPGPAPAPPPPHSRGRFLRTESRRRPQAAPPPSQCSGPAAALPAPVPPPLHRRGFPASASRLRGFSSALPPLRRGSIRRTARPHGPLALHRAALLNGHRRSHRPQRACAERRRAAPPALGKWEGEASEAGVQSESFAERTDGRSGQ